MGTEGRGSVVRRSHINSSRGDSCRSRSFGSGRTAMVFLWHHGSHSRMLSPGSLLSKRRTEPEGTSRDSFSNLHLLPCCLCCLRESVQEHVCMSVPFSLTPLSSERTCEANGVSRSWIQRKGATLCEVAHGKGGQWNTTGGFGCRAQRTFGACCRWYWRIGR